MRAEGRRATHTLVRRCEVCGAGTRHEVAFVKWGFPIYRCGACGLGSIDPLDDTAAIYQESYFQGGRRDGYANYAGSEAVLRREFGAAVAHLRRFVPGGRLLELGCAYGFFMLEARPHFACVGVEVSQAAAAAARARGLEVHDGALDATLAARLAPVDAAVMLDVIEHLERPAETLALLAETVRPGGVLMLTTGDWETPVARWSGERWRLLTPPQHVFYFSKRTLAALLGRCGFEVLEVSYPAKLVPLGLIGYQLLSRAGLRVPALRALDGVGLPATLFDAVRVIARRRP